MDWDSNYIRELIAAALAEVRADDASVAATIPGQLQCRAQIIAERDLICAGLPLAKRVFRTLDPHISVYFQVQDGARVERGRSIVLLAGKAPAILKGERPALGFLGHLSGIATLTRKLVDEITGTDAKICGPDATTPGLHSLEEYAVKLGGGASRWGGLREGLLLTCNHIALAGGIKAALDQAHSFVSSQLKPQAMTAYEAVGTTPTDAESTSLSVRIEVRDESELREALSAGAECVVLIGMSPEQARRCGNLARSIRPECVVEICGGFTLANARAYAETGAEFLVISALRGSAPSDGYRLLVEKREGK